MTTATTLSTDDGDPDHDYDDGGDDDDADSVEGVFDDDDLSLIHI